ncbi:di-heme oxidoredictase family protein [Engelhardtia mirabilis]|uniref:Cytochrome c domain-containing protein n=1 Tax=Engelhardtia mirabilis TaxID=2528011 RepID=A0A518BR08_9BACT|nr:hypothetical protein Pla133_45280 [Planctomycetes bacterium Pla133]QDV03734.1 hypothetical protein Pla86_45260 [Planctomycetes bacterium Pla86]
MRNLTIISCAALTLVGLAHAQEFQPRMGEPVRGLTPTQLAAFEAGKLEFETVLGKADGLGPIFNDSSCAQCHTTPDIGGSSTRTVTRFGLAATGGNPFDPLTAFGGSLLQSSALAEMPPEHFDAIPAMADVIIHRVTPHTFGAGLLEAVPSTDIEFGELNPPNGFVSGRVHWATPVEGGPLTAGRFGWKGGVPTVMTFSADASVNELGLSNRFFTADNAPQGDPALLALYDTVADPEDSIVPGAGRIDRQTDFQRYLAAPPQTPRSGMAGESVFTSIGCASCHTPQFTTGTAPEAALSGRTIRPYGDFLLHDMGVLGDGIVDGMASETEMSTRALWGMSSRDAFLHDGRATGGSFAQNVAAAIMWHDGEANFARLNFNALTPSDVDDLMGFLRSLGRAEFDNDLDGDVTVFDWFFLEPLFTAPGAGTVTPDSPGAEADIDADGDLDLEDFMQLQLAFTG